MESVESRLLQKIIPFDIIQMIAKYLEDVDHWRFRHVCKTTIRLPQRAMENEIKLKSYACSLIKDLSIPLYKQKIVKFDEYVVKYLKEKGRCGVSHTFDFSIQERGAMIEIYGCRHYHDYYSYFFRGKHKGIYVNYNNAEKETRINIMGNGDYIRVSEAPYRELLNVRTFPSFKDYNMYLWNAVKDTGFGQRNMSLFQEILN